MSTLPNAARLNYAGVDKELREQKSQLAPLGKIIESDSEKRLIYTQPSRRPGKLSIRINIRNKAITSRAKNDTDLVCLLTIKPELGDVILITKVFPNYREGQVGRLEGGQFIPR